MSLTKRHFEAIAAILKEQTNDLKPSSGTYATLKLTAQQLADYFKSENALFDRARFLTACGF